MKLRLAVSDDAPMLAKLHVDSWRAAYRDLVPPSTLERFTCERREQAFRASLAAHAEETYLIQESEEYVGLLTLGAARDSDVDIKTTGEIWGIYIAPEHWRHGVGSAVVREAEAILVSKGYRVIVLWVLEDNFQARLFYAAMGYRADGAAKNVNWGTVLEALRYRKELNAIHSTI